jgi:hypothetical protein
MDMNKEKVLRLFDDVDDKEIRGVLGYIFTRVFRDDEFSYNVDACEEMFFLKVLKVLGEEKITAIYGCVMSQETKECVLVMCKRKITSALAMIRGVNKSLRRNPDLIIG